MDVKERAELVREYRYEMKGDKLSRSRGAWAAREEAEGMVEESPSRVGLRRYRRAQGIMGRFRAAQAERRRKNPNAAPMYVFGPR